MGLDNTTAEAKLEYLLLIWPIERLRSMSLEQYANLDDHTSLCYLLEYGSRDLGEIGGIPLTKFGIWRFKDKKDFAATYQSDTAYAWSRKYGTSRTEAFKNIRKLVADIAEYAVLQDFEAVEDIEFHAIAKWKIAFVYSNKSLAPIYARENLLKVTRGLKTTFSENAPIVIMQRFLIDSRPADKTMIEFSRHLLDHFVEGKPFRDFFIIGSKYKDEFGNDTKDVFPIMVNNNCVAIGFLYNVDLTGLVGAPDNEIDRFVEKQTAEGSISIHKIKGYFRIFLNLKPGDIIAVKSHGLYNNLRIIAYAVVVQKEGKVYEYKPSKLGHHVNVEFVEVGIDRSLAYNYAATIHKISPDKHDHLKAVFGPFLQVDNIAFAETDDVEPIPSEQNLKSEESYARGAVSSRIVRQLHNIIQNSFFSHLKEKYPKQTIVMEFDGRVDILRDSGDSLWFYEIKPFENVVACLREATGQLIEYAFRYNKLQKGLILVIVGPSELKGDAKAFYNHFATQINLPLYYEQHVVSNRNE